MFLETEVSQTKFSSVVMQGKEKLHECHTRFIFHIENSHMSDMKMLNVLPDLMYCIASKEKKNYKKNYIHFSKSFDKNSCILDM